MLHIVHFLPTISLAEGGVTRAVLDLCSVMSDRGLKITLACCDAMDAPREWPRVNADDFKLDDLQRVPAVVEIGRLQRFGMLNRESLDQISHIVASANVLHLHAPWLASNTQIARIAREQSVPYILTVHGMLDDWSMAQRTLKKKIYLALVGNKMLNGAARVHCTAQGELLQAKKWIANDRTVVLPLLFDLSMYRELPGVSIAREKFVGVRKSLDANRPAVLFLSRLHPKKGIELLIDAATKLKSRGVECDIWIAGSGERDYENHLRKLIADSKLDDRISLLGMVSGAEKISLYQAADLFVLPTSQENFGLVLPEAMACETPVVTTHGVDIWPELEQAGARIVDRSSDAIASEIEKMLSDHAELKLLGKRGHAWVFDYLDSTRIAQEYALLYENIVRGV